MTIYELLYPYATILLATFSSVCTVGAGLYGFIEILRSQTLKGESVVPNVIGGTLLFAVACVGAMLELKLGAWVVSIGCS